MIKFILTLVLLLYSSLSFAQSELVYYYSSRKLDNEVSKEKAKFSETIIENDTVKTRTVRNLKKNEIVSSISYKGNEPVGTWVILYGSGPKEIDFNFKVAYVSKVCADGVAERSDFLDSDEVNGYTAPKLAGDYSDFGQFFSHNMVYPEKAVRERIRGTVETSFTITKEGVIENVVVNKGVNLVLDKEAMRVVRAMKFSAPPMIDGEATSICVKLPLTFRME